MKYKKKKSLLTRFFYSRFSSEYVQTLKMDHNISRKMYTKLYPYISYITIIYHYIDAKLQQIQTLIFHVTKKRDKELKILSSKSTQEMEKTMLVKTPFCFIPISQLVAEI